MSDYKSGGELLAAFGLSTREQKLEQACRALMEQLDLLHCEHKDQSLEQNTDNQHMFCSCMDAYRMGHIALNS